MKKLVQIILSLTLVLSMVACSNDTPEVALNAKKEESFSGESASQGEALPKLESSALLDPQLGYPMETPNVFAPNTKSLNLESSATQPTTLVSQSLIGSNPLPTMPVKVVSKDKEPLPEEDEMRAVWISYLDFEAILTGKNETQFTKNISDAFDKVKNLGLNTVIVQVRPFGDALYESEQFPWSYVAAGTEGKNPGFDPLELMVDLAHEKDLAIEAWVNPYRVRIETKKQALSKNNPVHKMLETGDAIRYNGGIYYNPASKIAQKLIVEGAREIVAGYDVDGIHFDDYFYPTTDAAFDATSFSTYQKKGGKLALGDWRRENVNQLVRQVYETIKQEDENAQFGISPQGNMRNNYDSQFIDVELWLSETGYVDYICPQIYFGFKNKICPYEPTVKAWNNQITAPGVKLYVGLAPYKIGTSDSWAGEGKYEWANSSSMMKDMITTGRKQSNYGGFIMFRYESLFYPASGVKQQVKTEIENLKGIL